MTDNSTKGKKKFKLKPKIGEFYKPRKTKPRKFITKNGESKIPEWLQIEECPCKIMSIDDEYITLNCFSASSDRIFRVSITEFKSDFIICPLIDCYITNLDKYPQGRILQSEFIDREEVKKLRKISKYALKIRMIK